MTVRKVVTSYDLSIPRITHRVAHAPLRRVLTSLRMNSLIDSFGSHGLRKMQRFWWLYLVFFCSGMSALVFETVWFRQAGLVLGNSVWASSMVLASFMAGLALGNLVAGQFGRRCRFPVRIYGILEVLIGAVGVGLVLGFPHLNSWLVPVLRPYADQLLLLNSMRLAVSFGLMLIPTVAMGATLPLMVSGLTAQDSRFGEQLGRLYACNTFGAMAGALGCEMFLIPTLGIRDTGFTAGACSLVAGLAAIAFGGGFRRDVSELPQKAEAAEPAVTPTVGRWQQARFYLATFLCGGILLALEVVWFRYMVLFNFGNSRVFAIMLAIVLAGIAIGGLIASRLSRSPRAGAALPWLSLASSLLTLLTYAIPAWMTVREKGGWGSDLEGWSTFTRALPVMLPVSILSGALFPLIGQALRREQESETTTAGRLTLCNTLGAAVGALLGGFVLLPFLGMEKSLILLGLLYAVVAALCVPPADPNQTANRNRMTLSIAVVLLTAFLIHQVGLGRRILDKVASRYVNRNTKIVALREGSIDTLMYAETRLLDQPLYHRLVTNTHSMSATDPTCQQYMRMYAYLPVALHPAPRKACLISFGCGVTAKALTDTKELESIDIVDISRDILDLNDVVYPDPADQPLRDPRVRVHIEDGRFHLQMTEERYDLITSEPPPPKGAGIVNLYSREYFQLIHDRLAESGMVTYWVPYHDISPGDGRAIIRAFCDVFTNGSVWMGSGDNWMLFGIRGTHTPVDVARFRRQWESPLVGPMMRGLAFESPEQFGSYFIADRDQLADWLKATEPVVDNFPQRISPTDSVVFKDADYVEWLKSDASRERFLKSDHIRSVWPKELIEAASPHFDERNYIHDLNCVPPNRMSGWRFGSLAAIHHLQTKTTLRTPVLWSLNSSHQHEAAVAKLLPREADNSQVLTHRAHFALADRDFNGAAKLYERVLTKLSPQTVEYQRCWIRTIYALCMAGKVDDARAIVSSRTPTSYLKPTATIDWQYLRETFDLPEFTPPSGEATEE